MSRGKGGELRLPLNNPSYDVDAPCRSVLEPMMDRLGEMSPAPELYILNAGSIPGGFLTSYIVKTQTPSTRDEVRAEREIRERQLRWLEELGGCTRANGEVVRAADTILIPSINSEEILYDKPVAYTAGQGKRRTAERATRQALIDAWNDVLFGGRASRRLDDVVWTRQKILAEIDLARGELDDRAVMLLAYSMSKIGYDEAYPLLVWVDKRGERYVVDGRHRKQAALERGLETVELERSYADVQDVLAAIVRADETRRGYDVDAAADRWAAIGVDFSSLRLRAGTDVDMAQMVREQNARDRAGQRGRKKDGVARPVGRPSTTGAPEIARSILARRAAGEEVNVTAEARAIGLSESTLRDAVRREQKKPRKPDIEEVSGIRRPAEPTVAAGVPTHTCMVCGITGQAELPAGWLHIHRGTFGEVIRGLESANRSGPRGPVHTLPSLGIAHVTCFRRLTVAERDAL